MRRDPRWSALKRELIVPVVLTAVVVGPACGGKDDTTTHASEAETDSDATGMNGMTGMTGSTGTTGDSTSEPTGGALPECRMYDKDAETCSDFIDCLYLFNQQVCIVRCQNFDDQAACETQEYCYWDSSGCYLAV